MFKKLLFGVLTTIASLHCVLLALTGTKILENTVFEGIGMTVLGVPYILHHLGLPVLANGGMSGWGWPKPNILGWFSAFIFWAVTYGGLAWLLWPNQANSTNAKSRAAD